MSVTDTLGVENEFSQRERTGRSWLVLVFALILMNMGIVATTVYFASSDGSAGVEPDYYARALKYDRVIEQRAVNARLGWRAAAAMRTGTEPGFADLTVTIVDREGNPVRDASVRAEIFSSLRSSERRTVTLNPEGGVYAAKVPISAGGLWRVGLLASRGADAFTSELDIMLDDDARSDQRGRMHR